MIAKKKYKIKEPAVHYQYIEISEEEAQKKLDEVFDFIFSRALEESRFDNLQSLSYTDNRLGGNYEREKNRVLERDSGI